MILKHSWKLIGLTLLLYVFSMVALVPLGPGLVEANTINITSATDAQNYTVSSGNKATIAITGFATHFNADGTVRAFLRQTGRRDKLIEASNIKIISSSQLVAEWLLPDTLPSRSWDIIINAPSDGTLLLMNGLFHKPQAVAEGSEGIERFWAQPLQESELHSEKLGFHFPYQPRIIESIRNLMLHVPMWFTMFLLMGIGFVSSIKSLRGGQAAMEHDAKSVAAVRTGLTFGVLGLITGSLWARFTWGAWWVNDPQLNGAMVTVLVYSGYLVLRASVNDPDLRARLAGVYNLFAFIILMILLMVLPRFTESLHPGKGGNPAFSKYDLDSALRLAFYPAVIGWMLLGTWMYTLSLRSEKLRRRINWLKEY